MDTPEEQSDDWQEHLKRRWRSIPSIATAFPELATREGRMNARNSYIVVANMDPDSPILIAYGLDEATAAHIAEVHNASLAK